MKRVAKKDTVVIFDNEFFKAINTDNGWKGEVEKIRDCIKSNGSSGNKGFECIAYQLYLVFDENDERKKRNIILFLQKVLSAKNLEKIRGIISQDDAYLHVKNDLIAYLDNDLNEE